MVSETEIGQLELHRGDVMIEQIDNIRKVIDQTTEQLTKLIADNGTIAQFEAIIDILGKAKNELDGVIENGTPTDDAWVLEGHIDNLLDEAFARMNALSK